MNHIRLWFCFPTGVRQLTLLPLYSWMARLESFHWTCHFTLIGLVAEVSVPFLCSLLFLFVSWWAVEGLIRCGKVWEVVVWFFLTFISDAISAVCINMVEISTVKALCISAVWVTETSSWISSTSSWTDTISATSRVGLSLSSEWLSETILKLWIIRVVSREEGLISSINVATVVEFCHILFLYK